MSSTATDSRRRFTVFTLVLYWTCTLSGLAIPWIATVAVDMANTTSHSPEPFVNCACIFLRPDTTSSALR
jgi:hypothetical protein